MRRKGHEVEPRRSRRARSKEHRWVFVSFVSFVAIPSSRASWLKAGQDSRYPLPLLDAVSQGPGVHPDPLITRDDRDTVRRLIEQLRRRQVDRVERADWLDGKRPAHAIEHGLIHIEDEAPPLERAKSAYCDVLILGGQPAGRSRTDDGPSGF